MLPCKKCGNFYVVRAKSYARGLCPKCANKDDILRIKAYRYGTPCTPCTADTKQGDLTK